jgi:hypothetical protein
VPSDLSAQDGAGHVDLDVVTTILRVLTDPAATAECRFAFALVLNEEQAGVRTAERSSGLHHDQIRQILQDDGQVSPYGLIRTVERGRSWDSDGREKAIYELTGIGARTGHHTSPIPNSLSSLPPPKKEEGKDLEKSGDRYAHRFADLGVRALADPAMDLWSRHKDQLGSERAVCESLSGSAVT